MSFCTEQILLLASGVYDDIGSPSSQSVAFISGWLVSSGTLGELNNRLNTCFYIDGACIEGGFGPNEASILVKIYESNYYKRRALQILNGDISWTSMKEGDTTITREASSNLAREYRQLHKALEEDIRIATANWKTGRSIPGTVDSTDLPAWPSP